MAIGIVDRTVPLGLPPFIVKWLRSIVWGSMAYAMMGVLSPRACQPRRILAAAVIATASEFFRLYHTPGLDAFRLTLWGRLLIGRVFTPANILAYLAGIMGAAAIERVQRRMLC